MFTVRRRNMPAISEPLFYCPTLAPTGEIRLSGDEAHHITVQRLRVGDALALFDGRGEVAYGHIRTVGRRDVDVKIERRHHEPAPTLGLDLYCALPKGDRVSVLLDMATQLGMTRFTPIHCERSIVEPNERTYERWQRLCLEACKQSRRLYLPELMPPLPLESAVQQANEKRDYLLVAHPSADVLPTLLSLRSQKRLAIFIGPEGGLTDREIDELKEHNAHFVQLGEAILRIETAAIAMLSIMKLLATGA